MSLDQAQDRPAAPPDPPRRRGRPLLGAVAGLLLGLFVALDLQQFGVRPLDNLSVFGLPLLGLAAGLALGRWAPLARAGQPSSSRSDR